MQEPSYAYGEINEGRFREVIDFSDREQADRIKKVYIKKAQIVATTVSMCGAKLLRGTNFDWVSHCISNSAISEVTAYYSYRDKYIYALSLLAY